MKNLVEPAEETTQAFRERGELDENGYCFYSTTEFVPESERALGFAMAGNTGDCDDPTRRRARMNTAAVALSRSKRTVGTARYAAPAGKPSKKRTMRGAAGRNARGSFRAEKEKFSIYPYAKRKKYATM